MQNSPGVSMASGGKTHVYDLLKLLQFPQHQILRHLNKKILTLDSSPHVSKIWGSFGFLPQNMRCPLKKTDHYFWASKWRNQEGKGL